MRAGRFVVFFFFFSFTTRVIPQSAGNPDKSAKRVWFALEGGSKQEMPIIPMFVEEGAKLYGVPVDCSDFEPPNKDYTKLEDEYFQSGRVFQVLFGGARAGEITVADPRPGYGRAYGTYNGNAPIHGMLSALATSRAAKAKSSSSRKPPTRSQEAAAKELARNLFTAAGVTPSLLNGMQTNNLTVTTVLPSKELEILGSFKVEGEDGEVHGLFFIARAGEKPLAPEYKWIHIANSEDASETMRFVDQADLFGDSREEIITEIRYYENWQYIVLAPSSANNKWEKVFETDVLGCE